MREMQKQQPRFTEEQKKELAEVHPWVKKGLLPKAINVMACVDCGSNPASRLAPLYDTEPHAMELSATLEPMEEGSGAPPCLDMAMEEEEVGAGCPSEPGTHTGWTRSAGPALAPGLSQVERRAEPGPAPDPTLPVGAPRRLELALRRVEYLFLKGFFLYEKAGQ
uniref:Period circadian-like C-terminal domain-containing protein n=1 Tax=Gopherus agassizii TaxID=38772 RepID=A0A452GN98_9SAUR